jgi:hypothetical protein
MMFAPWSRLMTGAWASDHGGAAIAKGGGVIASPLLFPEHSAYPHSVR